MLKEYLSEVFSPGNHAIGGTNYFICIIIYYVLLMLLINEIPSFKNYKKWIHLIGSSLVFFLAFLVLGFPYYCIFGIMDMHIYVNAIVSLVIGFTMSKYNLVTRLTSIPVFFTFYLASSYLGTNLLLQLDDAGIAINGWFILLACCISFSLMSGCVIALKLMSFRDYDYAPVIGTISVLIFTLADIYLPSLWGLGDTLRRSMVQSITLLALESLVYVTFYFSTREHYIRMDKGVEEKLHERDHDSVVISKGRYEKLMEIRHEINHQYLYLRDLAEAGKYDELKDFLTKENEANELMELPISGNEIVDSVISSEILKAKHRNAKIQSKLAIPPQIPMGNSKLYSLLLNLLDNAIEAIKRFDIQDGVININMRFVNNILFIKVTNPTKDPDGDIKGLKTTKKVQKELHGYGTKIIKNIVDEYNGAISYSVKNGIFIADLMLCFDNGVEK